MWQKLLSVAAVASPNIKELFGPSLSANASIYLASDVNYTSRITQRWSVFAEPSYVGTIQPATVVDIQNIVNIAAAHEIPFLATGGGHGISIGLSGIVNGLEIDLRNFNSVAFDASSSLLTVGGAVKFSQLVVPLSAAGAQFPIGTADCVGVVGATLGAGVSSSQGYTGLLIDLLQEVQLVTAQGAVLIVSRSEHSDLFWALCGAGANFGIVASATYRVPQTVNGGNVTNANYLFAANQTMAVYEYLKSLDEEMPAALGLNIVSSYSTETASRAILVNANYAGSPDAAAHLLAPLDALQPLRAEVLEVSWTDVLATQFFGVGDTKACTRNQVVDMRSIGARSTSPETFVTVLQEMERFTIENPAVWTTFMIHRFPTQKVLEIGDSETMYPHRAIQMHIQLESEYVDRATDGPVEAFLNAASANLTAVSGFDYPAVYVNFAHGNEGPEAWYGARNIERLTRLKRRWDPKGIFSFYNAVPLHVETSEV